VIIDALDSLVFLFYEDEMSAIIISTLTGISSILCVLPLYDLAARATPKRSESLGYALIFSVWNFADAISDMLGSSLYDNYNLGFNELVWINTFTTAAILFLIPILPKWITKYTDL
jgi:predicted MFS family arabinose efflux permease